MKPSQYHHFKTTSRLVIISTQAGPKVLSANINTTTMNLMSVN
jgi:hypothetical protein